MDKKLYNPNAATHSKNMLAWMVMGFIAVAMLTPGFAFAQAFQETGQKVCGFFDNIHSILNMTSLAVVTVAVIFSGYQIAFAHKRIGDVAPVLLGGVFIGAAGQVAKMVIGNDSTACQPSGGSATSMVLHLLNYYA